jgi:ribosomal protein L7/L12
MTKKSVRKQLEEQGNPVVLTLADALALAHGQGAGGRSGEETALEAIHTRIDTRYGGGEDVRKLSPGERGLLLCRAMLDEVHNGGLDQYLWNSAGDDAEELRGFLRRAGMNEAAGFLDKVAELFPDCHIPCERQVRQTRLDEIADVPPSTTMMDEMSRRLVALSPSFARPLLRYVEAHREEFTQPGDDLVKQGIRSRRIRELQGVQAVVPNWAELQAATATLERLAAELAQENDRSALAQVERQLAAGRRADAIMSYRQHFACSLAEAKAAVERLQRGRGSPG